jgi:cytochrome c oxidase cbb3-type subunit 2
MSGRGKSGAGLIAGIFALFVAGWFGTVVIPMNQIGNLQPSVDADTGAVYPVSGKSWADRGRDVYVANGCMYCHTQLVRPSHSGPEMARKWGERSTVSRDLIYETPPQIGVSRVGPDLANIGARKDVADPSKYNDAWYYALLYQPRAKNPDSVMPAYRNLFKKQRLVGAGTAEALDRKETDVPEGWEIVPNADAKALVAYLRSLDRSFPLNEASTAPEAAP